MEKFKNAYQLDVDTSYLTNIEIEAQKLRAQAFATFFTALFEGISKTANGVVGRVANAMERSRVSNELYAMDDRTLEDIGLTRGDIEAVMNGQLTRQPLQPIAANIEFLKKPVAGKTNVVTQKNTRIAA